MPTSALGLDEELAGPFKKRVFGTSVQTKGKREARRAELSEFGVALSRMMERRAIGSPGLAAVLVERGYRGVSENELRDYVEGNEPVPTSLPVLLVEGL